MLDSEESPLTLCDVCAETVEASSIAARKKINLTWLMAAFPGPTKPRRK